MTDDLTEKVARAICAQECNHRGVPCNVACRGCIQAATAALAACRPAIRDEALEEAAAKCAKVRSEREIYCDDQAAGARFCVEAIRAMKGAKP